MENTPSPIIPNTEQTKSTTAINLISDSLEYYDNNTEKYTDFFKKVKYIEFIHAVKDMDHNVIRMYDTNKNEILKSRYEIIGVYNNKSKTWTWAWAIPRFRKNTTHIVRKIINYGMDLDPESRFLKTELITSRFRITNPIQLDIHAAIASYLSRQYVVYKYISYINPSVDINKRIDITNKPRDHADEYSVYYMFLLDYNLIQEKK